MNRAEVELDPLADTDRAGAKHQHLLPVSGLSSASFSLPKTGVIVRRLGRELRRAGIYHLEGSTDAVCMTHLLDLVLRVAGESCDHIIREFDALCFL